MRELKFDKRGAIKLGIAGLAIAAFLGILFLIFFSVSSEASAESVSKDRYFLGDKIKLDIRGFGVYRIKIETPSTSYIVKEKKGFIIFKPQETGSHRVIIYSLTGRNFYDFEVIEKKQPDSSAPSATSKRNKKDSEEIIAVGKPVRWRKLTTNQTIELPPLTANISIRKISNNSNMTIGTVRNFVIKHTKNKSILKITEPINNSEELLEVEFYTEPPKKIEKPLSERKKEITIYSPPGLNYTNVLSYTTIPELTNNKELIKVYWKEENKYLSFNASDTDGDGLLDYVEWIVPHLSNQTFEISINIINVQSYPVVGGNWSVKFTTTGTADLTIRGINGTTFGKDLEFLELKCGNTTISKDRYVYDRDNNIITVKNWQCNQTATETSRVLTTGKHTLEFSFGGEKAYAYNYASGWWNVSWGYRKVHNITGSSAGAQTNYQVRFRIYNVTGTDNGENVYLGSKVNPDFSDVRFVNNTGDSLSYWIEETGSNYSIFWVKISEIPAAPSNASIYIYYGNPDAQSESNGNTVFLLYDDFEDGDINGWTTYGSGVCQYSTDSQQGGVILKTSNNDPNGCYAALSETVSGFEARFLTNRINNNGGALDRYSLGGTTSCSGYGPRKRTDGTATDFIIEERSGTCGATSLVTDTQTSSQNTWYKQMFRYYNQNMNYTMWDMNNNLVRSITASDPTYSSFSYFFIHGGWEFLTDDIRIRKYVEPEPSHGEWGAEEIAPVVISIISPLNQSYKSSSIDFNVSLNRNGSWCGFSLDGQPNISMTKFNDTYFNYTKTGIADGEHNVSFSCNNTQGIMSFSNYTYFIIDSTPPIWYGLDNSNSTPAVGDDVSFWSYWNDTFSLSNWSFSWNASGTWENVSFGNFSGITNISNTTLTIPGSAGGKIVGYIFYARDSLGNENFTSTGTINVSVPPDSENPSINSWSNAPSIQSYGQTFTIKVNVTDNVGVYSVRVNVTYPNGSSTWIDLSQDFPGSDNWTGYFSDTWQWGNYSYYVWANDSAGNTNDTSSSPSEFYVRANLSFSLKTEKDIYGANQNVKLKDFSNWLDSGWEYRKPINISENSGNNLNEFQINLSIDTQSLISNGKMNSDCSDIRFADSSGNKMSYWIEEGCNTPSTIIWVKVNLSALQNKTIYMYYGNSTASSESNLSSVMGIIEFGVINVSDEVYSTVNLTNSFLSPVVVASPEYLAGPNAPPYPMGAIIRNVTSQSFEVKVDRPSGGLTGTITPVHYIVMESGSWNILNSSALIQAGTINTTKDSFYSSAAYFSSPNYAEVVNFPYSFNSAPVILSARMTENNALWAVTYVGGEGSRTTTPSTSSMDLGLLSGQLGDQNFVENETLGWIGIDSGSKGDYNGVKWSAENSADIVAGWATSPYSWTTSFTQTYASQPKVIVVGKIKEDGGNGGWAALSQGNSSASAWASFIDETLETDRAHTSEVVSAISFETNSSLPIRKYATVLPSFAEGTEERFSNFLKNNRNENASGYLVMQVIKNSTGEIISTQVDDVSTDTLRDIFANNFLELFSIWNSNPWNTDSQSGGYYKIYATLRDKDNNILINDDGRNISGEYIFYLDISPPNYTNFGKNESIVDPLDYVEFYALWDDNGVLDRWELWWNASGTWENPDNGSFSSTPGWSNTTLQIPSSAEASIFAFYFKAYDTTGASNVTVNDTITVRDVTSPFLDNESVSPSQTNRYESATLSVDVEDNSAVESVWATIGISNGSLTNVSLSYVSGNLYRTDYSSSEIGVHNATFYANDTSGNLGQSSTTLFWDVYGYANVSVRYPSNGDNFSLASIISMECLVMDTNTSAGIQDYPIEFWHNSSLLGTNTTNSSGIAVFDINTSGYEEGTHLLNCTIDDNSTLYYNKSYSDDSVQINILYPYINLTDLDYENSFSYGIAEYEVGDIIDWINVTVNNTGGAVAYNVNVTINIINEGSLEVSWTPNETKTCGNLGVGQICELRFDNSSFGYKISESESSGNYYFRILMEWFGEGSGSSVNASYWFNLYQIKDNFSSSLSPVKIVQGESSVYNFTITNPWSKNLTEVNVTITCPSVNMTCFCLGTSLSYCSLGNITSGSSKTASFNITTNSSTVPADYEVNASVSYSNPGAELKTWIEQRTEVLQVRGPTVLRVNITEFPANATRGHIYDLKGYVNNTGNPAVTDLYLNWSIPSGWVNITGDLNRTRASLTGGSIWWNNVTVNLTELSQLGPMEIELRSESANQPADWQTETVYVFSNTTIDNVLSNNSNPFRNESITLQARLLYDNGTVVNGESLKFYLGGYYLGNNITNSSGVAVLSASVPYNASLGINLVNVTHDGGTSAWTNPSSNDSLTVSVKDEISITGISATPQTTGYGFDVKIKATVWSRVEINTVRVNITYPNSSWRVLTMTNAGGDLYEVNFTDTWQWGNYSYYIIANNTAGFENDTSSNPLEFYVRANISMNVMTEKDIYYINEKVLLSDERWWDDMWLYKKPININNSYKEKLYEYQLEIIVNTSDLYSKGKIRNDCGDIRFVWYNSSSKQEENISYYMDYCDINSNSLFWVKVPEIPVGSSAIYMYYGNPLASNASDIESTFSYSEPRVVGYIVNERMANADGGLISLSNGNTIVVGASTFNLGKGQTTIVPAADLSLGNNVSAKGLFQLDSTVSVTDTISPISWAGTEFYYYIFRGTNQFGIVSPFGEATVRIYDAGIEVSGSPFTVNGSATINADITDGNVVRISSDIPILVQHFASSQAYDSILFYNATIDYLYGVPSNYLLIGSGPDGAVVEWFTNGTGSGGTTLGANQGYSNGGGAGSDGTADAYRVNGSSPIGVLQLADSDGTEGTTFLPGKELGTLFGSYYAVQYIAIATPNPGTNCTLYNNLGSPIASQVAPSTPDEVYKMCFNCGSDAQYTPGGWRLECTDPVFAYFEEDSTTDETQLWSWKQMRQYVYPSPTYSFGNETNASRAFNHKEFDTKAYVVIEIQSNSSGVWETVNTTVNDTETLTQRTISVNGSLDIKSISDSNAWNTSTNPVGYYRVRVSLTDSYGNVLRNDDGTYLNSTYIFQIKDTIPPSVALYYPQNNTNFSSYFVPSFNFSVTEDYIDSCELWGNWSGGWHLNKTVVSPPTDTNTSFLGVNTTEDGYFIWNVRCNDTSGNTGWGSANLTFAAFLFPEEVNSTSLNITQTLNNGKGNITIFWNASSHAFSYRIYYSTNLSDFIFLNETSQLNYTDTEFANSGDIRRFYRVDAWNPTGQNSSSSYMGVHIYSLNHNGNTKNWITFPSNASYLMTANDSLNEITNATAFTMWNATIQKRVTCNAFSCPEPPSCTDTNCNFNLVAGLGYEVNINSSSDSSINWSMIGIANAPANITLIKNSSSYGKNWIGLYANTSLTNAQAILQNISYADSVTNWNSVQQVSEGLIPSPFPWIPYLGTNFNTQIEKGYEVSVTQSMNWTQA